MYSRVHTGHDTKILRAIAHAVMYGFSGTGGLATTNILYFEHFQGEKNLHLLYLFSQAQCDENILIIIKCARRVFCSHHVYSTVIISNEKALLKKMI